MAAVWIATEGDVEDFVTDQAKEHIHMRRFLIRAAGGAALVSARTCGTVNAFAAEGSGGDVLPANHISQADAQAIALQAYPGTAAFDGVQDHDGTIVYGFTVTSNSKVCDVHVNTTPGANPAMVQADDGGQRGGADTGSADQAG